MLRILLFITIVTMAPLGAAQAQTVSDTVAQMLKSQGFTISSTRFTWLRRIAVEATNGVYVRDILVSRGEGVILQDEWHLINGSDSEPPQTAPSPPEGPRPQDAPDRPEDNAAPGPGQGGPDHGVRP